MSFKSFFTRPWVVFTSAIVLRAALLVYGHYQDEWSALKYTDIDYYVFTDAARSVANGRSPYLRDTYRYTPLLAWLLVPTSWPGWFDFGKVIFAASDVLAGWLMYRIQWSVQGMDQRRALKYACIWLLNPMVAQISTRGSSEGLLIVLVMALLWATLMNRHVLTGSMLGLAVHFKIYPFIYASSIAVWLATPKVNGFRDLYHLFNKRLITVAFSSATVFMALNSVMFAIYGHEFVNHSFLYHFVRSDHRHNFSPYNLLLYMNSSPGYRSDWQPEAYAFVPQLFLSAVLIPVYLASKDLPATMLAQTLVFVAFNKVCTSQYFLWYLAFLPFHLPSSSLLQNGRKGAVALALWILGQAVWLQQGYQLEFLGKSSFVPGIWLACILFFIVNVWLIGVVVGDIRDQSPQVEPAK